MACRRRGHRQDLVEVRARAHRRHRYPGLELEVAGQELAPERHRHCRRQSPVAVAGAGALGYRHHRRHRHHSRWRRHRRPGRRCRRRHRRPGPARFRAAAGP